MKLSLKEIIIGVIFILTTTTVIVILYLFFQISQTHKLNEESFENLKIDNQKINKTIKVKLPEEWINLTDSKINNEYQFQKNSAILSITTKEFYSTDLSYVIFKEQEIQSESYNNVIFSDDLEDLTIDGYSTIKYSFTVELSTLNFKYTHVYINVDDTIYAISVGDLVSNYDSNVNDFEAIINGISFE